MALKPNMAGCVQAVGQRELLQQVEHALAIYPINQRSGWLTMCPFHIRQAGERGEAGETEQQFPQAAGTSTTAHTAREMCAHRQAHGWPVHMGVRVVSHDQG